MKQLIVLVVVLHTICMAVKGEESWEDICKKERAQGNLCILSKWICKGNSETQTMQIVRRYGSASRSRSRSPCRGSGGGDRGGKGKKGTIGCKNVNTTASCEYWKELGYCKKYYVGFMKKNCCKTCKEKGIKDTWEEECKKIRKKGNKCELSFGECKKGWKQQTMKITYPGGAWYKKWRMLPCKVTNMISEAGELTMDMEEGGVSGGCKDIKKVFDCEYWKELRYCTNKYYAAFMKKNCCKTCNEKGIKDTWEEECKKIRKKGNKCELSIGKCNKKWKKQTMKITYPGGWFKKWRTLPCGVANYSSEADGESSPDMGEGGMSMNIKAA